MNVLVKQLLADTEAYINELEIEALVRIKQIELRIAKSQIEQTVFFSEKGGKDLDHLTSFLNDWKEVLSKISTLKEGMTTLIKNTFVIT